MTILEKTRARLEPRELLPDFVPPRWMRPTDENLRDGRRLMREGQLRFGALISFDRNMERYGTADGLGFVTYSRAPVVEREPLMALRIAEWLRDLTADGPNPELSALARALSGSKLRGRVPVPPGQTGGVPFLVAPLAIRRGDLPGRPLRSSFLPILEHEEIDSIIALPAECWVDDLHSAWIDLGG